MSGCGSADGSPGAAGRRSRWTGVVHLADALVLLQEADEAAVLPAGKTEPSPVPVELSLAPSEGESPMLPGGIRRVRPTCVTGGCKAPGGRGATQALVLPGAVAQHFQQAHGVSVRRFGTDRRSRLPTVETAAMSAAIARSYAFRRYRGAVPWLLRGLRGLCGGRFRLPPARRSKK